MNTKTKYLVIVAVAVLILAAGAFVYLSPAVAPGPEAGGENIAPSGTSPSGAVLPESSDITMAQVAAHADAASCWTVIRGNVYDLTSWVAKHPGGQAAILGICGKDGTEKFVGKHGGKEPQEDTLASFKIGALAQ